MVCVGIQTIPLAGGKLSLAAIEYVSYPVTSGQCHHMHTSYIAPTPHTGRKLKFPS